MALKSFAGGSVFGASHGQSPPSILALHGWGRTHRDFDGVLGGFDALALDLPGFGASPEPPEVWGADQYADAVLGTLGEFESPPIVVGHSFGGRVAVSLAARHPDKVGSLVLIGVPLLRPPDRVQARSPFSYRLVRWANRRGMVSDVRMEAARQRYGSTDYRAAQGRMRDILVKVVNETYEAELDQLSAPVHLLWGVNDTAAPISVARAAERRLAERGATVTLEALDGIGHHVMAEAPDRVRSRLAEQLGSAT